MVSDSDRGILTNDDRAYLAGESEIQAKSQAERNARARIRNRVKNALSDFRYLADPDCFQERDLEQIRDTTVPAIDDTDFPKQDVLAPSVRDALPEIVAFIFRMQPSVGDFEATVAHGVRIALDRLPQDAQLVGVSVDVKEPERILKEAEEKYENGEPMTDAEVRSLIERSDIPAADIREYVQEQSSTRTLGDAIMNPLPDEEKTEDE